jgi:uncharacterized membrane protein YiaA
MPALYPNVVAVLVGFVSLCAQPSLNGYSIAVVIVVHFSYTKTKIRAKLPREDFWSVSIS